MVAIARDMVTVPITKANRIAASGPIPVAFRRAGYRTNHTVKPSVTPKEKAATRALDDGLALCGGEGVGDATKRVVTLRLRRGIPEVR